MNATQTTTIAGRTYEVDCVKDAIYESLKAQGFDGYAYFLLGKRGACLLAYRSAKTGKFTIIAR